MLVLVTKMGIEGVSEKRGEKVSGNSTKLCS